MLLLPTVLCPQVTFAPGYKPSPYRDFTASYQLLLQIVCIYFRPIRYKYMKVFSLVGVVGKCKII